MKDYILLLRPAQWVKNLFLFAPAIFSRELFRPDALALVTGAFTLFCLLSSAIYVFNDIQDAGEDAKHPIKKNRPLPAKRVPLPRAWSIFGLLSAMALAGSFALNAKLGFAASAYYLLNIIYSLTLKHTVILDVFSISLSFLIRVIAGAVVINVVISDWLLICSFLLALFLAMAKRRHEIVLLENNAGSHRKVLDDYSPYYLDQMIAVVTSAVVISYILYTISPHTVEQFGTTKLVYTSPFVLYGIFRYLYLVHKKDLAGNPTKALFMDRPLWVTVILWLGTCIAVIYS